MVQMDFAACAIHSLVANGDWNAGCEEMGGNETRQRVVRGMTGGEPAANRQKRGVTGGEPVANRQKGGVTGGEPAANRQKECAPVAFR